MRRDGDSVVRSRLRSTRRSAGRSTVVLAVGATLAALLVSCSQSRSSSDPAPTPTAGQHQESCLLIATRASKTGTEVTALVDDGWVFGHGPGDEPDVCMLRESDGKHDPVLSVSMVEESMAAFEKENVGQWLDTTGDEQIFFHELTTDVEMYGGLSGDRLVYEAAGDGTPFRRFVQQSGDVRTDCAAPRGVRCERDLAGFIASLRLEAGVRFRPPGSEAVRPPPGFTESHCTVKDASGRVLQVSIYLPSWWRPLVPLTDPHGVTRCRSRAGSGRTSVVEVTLSAESLQDFRASLDQFSVEVDQESIMFTSRYLAGRPGYAFSFAAGSGPARYRLFAVQLDDLRLTCRAPAGGRGCGPIRRTSWDTLRVPEGS